MLWFLRRHLGVSFVKVPIMIPVCRYGRQFAIPLASHISPPPYVQSAVLACWLGFGQAGLSSIGAEPALNRCRAKALISDSK